MIRSIQIHNNIRGVVSLMAMFVTDRARSPGSGNPPIGLPRYNPLWTQDAHVADLGRHVARSLSLWRCGSS
jgi:hypothetical protein